MNDNNKKMLKDKETMRIKTFKVLKLIMDEISELHQSMTSELKNERAKDSKVNRSDYGNYTTLHNCMRGKIQDLMGVMSLVKAEWINDSKKCNDKKE